MTQRTILLSVLLYGLSLFSFANSRYYVAKNGSDNNSGSIDKPLASLQKAVELSNADNFNSEIIIREGVYFLKNGYLIENAKSDDSLRINSMKGEKVIFHGGLFLRSNDFKPVKSATILNRIPAESRNKIVQIDLKKYGLRKINGIKHHGFGIIPEPSSSELFVNGRPQSIARYPNDSTLKIGKVYDKGSVPRAGDYSNRGPIFGFTDDRILRWSNADDIWIHGKFSYGFSDEHLKLKKIDPLQKTIQLVQPHLYGVFTGMAEYIDPKKPEEKAGLAIRGYYAYNMLEEIDRPGEYFIDRKNSILYYYPEKNDKNAEYELSVVDEPLLSIKNSKNIRISGINFSTACGMGILLEDCEKITIENCKFTNFGTVAISLGHPLRNNTNGFIQDGSPKQWQRTSDRFTDIIIRNCDILNMGCGGVILDGGDRKTLTASGNKVENCFFKNTDRINQSYSPAVKMFGVGNVVKNCTFTDTRHQVISFLGNDHIIEYCRFENVVYDADDMGAIYTGRDPTSRGTIIRYNYFKNLLPKSPQTSMSAVYIDDGSGGMIIHDNLFYRSGNPGHYGVFGAIYVNIGFDNRIFNNTFIDCKVAFGHNTNHADTWDKLYASKLFNYRMYEEVDTRSDLYRKKYPELIQYENNSSRRLNYMEYNWMIGTQTISFGDVAMRRNNTIPVAPLAPEEFDYSSLKKNYQAFNIPDIKKIGQLKN